MKPEDAAAVPDVPDEPAGADEPAPRRVAGMPVAEALGLSAADVGRAALHRAKAAARARGLRPGSPGRPSRQVDPAEQRSGPGRDARDPVPIGETAARLADERGWRAELSVGGVIGRWREVVGDQVAEHCTPETFDDGILAVRADSTAWATNLTLLVPELIPASPPSSASTWSPRCGAGPRGSPMDQGPPERSGSRAARHLRLTRAPRGDRRERPSDALTRPGTPPVVR